MSGSGERRQKKRKRPEQAYGLYDTGPTLNNHVPIDRALWSIIGQTYPILYFPEYAQRRLSISSIAHSSNDHPQAPNITETSSQEKARTILHDFSHIPQSLAETYTHMLTSCRRNHTSDSSSNTTNTIDEVVSRIIVIPFSEQIIPLVARRSCNLKPKDRRINRGFNSISRTREVQSNPISLTNSRSALPTIVNSAIASLVHLREKTKRKHRLQITSKKRGDRRLKLASDLTTSQLSKQQFQELNQVRNLLSEGYTYLREGDTRSEMSMPNVKCTYPNSSVTYIYTSPVMKRIHAILGDDGLREILMYCHVLIPCLDIEHGKSDTDFRGSLDSWKENYFQLCGSDLTNHTAGIDAKPKSLPARTRQETCDPHWLLPRYEIFYSEEYVKKVGLPPKHILNQFGTSDGIRRNARLMKELLDRMVHLKYGNNQGRKKRWRRLRDNGMTICEMIVKRHRRCDYTRILERYCPISNDIQAASLSELSQSALSQSQVISFLSAVLKSVFPSKFWGSSHNYQSTLKTVRTFVSMRRRENFPMKSILSGLRVTDITWLFPDKIEAKSKANRDKPRHVKKKVPRSSHEAATRLTYNIMQWLYCDYIIPLVRSIFYVTDTEFSGQKTNFYRKPVFAQLRLRFLAGLQKQQYVPISVHETIQRVNSQKLGFSQLRLLPKMTGVRPIVLLNKIIHHSTLVRQRTKTIDSLDLNSKKVSTNTVLGRTLDVLQSVHKKQPRFGYGMYGLNELQNRVCSFVQELQHLRSKQRDGERVPLYFASVDVQHCYDTIDQDYLYDLLKGIITEKQYLLQKHSVLFPYSNSGGSRRKFIKNVGAPGELKDFSSVRNQLSSNHFKSIICDNDAYSIVNSEDMMALLGEHLSSHIVTSGHQCFAQKRGIPQGSILSSILCNFYLGDVETKLLDGIPLRSDHLHAHMLVRIVDDYMLITTDLETSSRFMRRMKRGNPTLGMKINEGKSRVSYDYSDHKGNFEGKRSIISYENGTFFPWCGLLFNVETCEVQIDYERFHAVPTVDTLTVDRAQSPGKRLLERMKSFLRPRCIPILYDSRINSREVIQLNLHQSFMYSAEKTKAYISEMLGGMSQNFAFIQRCITSMIDFGYRLISSRLKAIDDEQNSMSNTDVTRTDIMLYWLSRQEAMHLGKNAFMTVFSTES